MKIKDLPKGKSAVIGTLIPGMRTISKIAHFPELALKRVGDVRSAAAWGGIMIKVRTKHGDVGYLFYACQDIKQLLDVDIQFPVATSIELSHNGVFWTGPTLPALSYYNALLDPKDTTTWKSGDQFVPDASVEAWCAVITPCNGYGHHGFAVNFDITKAEASMQFSLGAITSTDELQGGWGRDADIPEVTGAQSNALVLWRDVPLRKKFREVYSDTAAFDKLLEYYPSNIRDDASHKVAEEIEAIGGAAVSVSVTYARQLDGKRLIGLGLQNKHTFRSYGEGTRVAIQAYRSGYDYPPSNSAEPRVRWTVIEGLGLDIGFRPLLADGKRGFGYLSGPSPVFGYDIATSKIPESIYVCDTELKMTGLVGDFLATSTRAQVTDLIDPGVKVHGSDVPSLNEMKDNDSKASEKSVGAIYTSESAGDNDLLVLTGNVLARVDAFLGDGRSVHRTIGRLFEGTEPTADKATQSGRFLLQLPGSTVVNGRSKHGAQVAFSCAGKPVLSVRPVRYNDVDYIVVDVKAGGKDVLSVAEANQGDVVAESTGKTRGQTVFDGKTYGTAAAGSGLPAAGALFVVRDSGLELLQEIAVTA